MKNKKPIIPDVINALRSSFPGGWFYFGKSAEGKLYCQYCPTSQELLPIFNQIRKLVHEVEDSRRR